MAVKVNSPLEFFLETITLFPLENRNIQEEEYLIKKSLVEFTLLRTLGTAKTHQWLLKAVQEGNFLCTDQYRIVTKSHLDSDAHPKENPFPFIVNPHKLYLGNVFIEQTPKEKIRIDPSPSLLSIYQQQRGFNEDSAVGILAEQFSIEDDVYSVSVPCEKNWEQVPRYQYDLPGPNECHKSYFFMGKHGQKILEAKETNIQNGYKVILPITFWSKIGNETVYPFSIPGRKPYPLFNLDKISKYPDATVFLTDNITNTGMIYNTSALNILTSWIGGLKAVKYVDWQPLLSLKNGINYLITQHSGLSDKEMFQTALAVCVELKKIGVTVKFYQLESIRPIGKNTVTAISLNTLINRCKEFGLNIPKELEADYIRLSCNQELDKLITNAAGLTKQIEIKTLLFPFLTRDSVSLLCCEPQSAVPLSLGMGYAVAIGETILGTWKAKTPEKVLFLSELDADILNNTVIMLQKLFPEKDAEIRKRHEKSFMFLSLRRSPLNLLNPNDQAKIERYLFPEKSGEHISLLVIGNLRLMTAFCESGKFWNDLFLWLVKLRNRGCSTLIVHDIFDKDDPHLHGFDNVLEVIRNWDNDDTILKLSMKISRSPLLLKASVKTIQAIIHLDPDKPKWINSTPAMTRTAKDELLLEHYNAGTSIEDIAKELGVKSSAILKRLKKLEFDGSCIKRRRTMNPKSVIENHSQDSSSVKL